MVQTYSDVIDNLKKNTIDIKSKVFEDFTTIAEKFPCNDKVAELFHRFVSNLFFVYVKYPYLQ